MTIAEKINRVRTLLGEEAEVTDAAVTEYLSIAEETIAMTRYPFSVPDDYVPSPKYDSIQCELAARGIVRQGGLGEIDHEENGINRTWYSSDDRDLLSRITPFAKIG